MPWINVVTNKELSIAEQEELKAGLGLLMHQILDKEETGLMVTFLAANGIYRAGERQEHAAVVEVKYIGQYPAAKKAEVTRCIIGLMARVIEIEQTKVIVPFGEFPPENYGRLPGIPAIGK